MRRALPFLRQGPQPLRSPQGLPSLAAWYDASDPNSLVYDGSNRVSLVADKSGNSNVNCLQAVGNGAALTASLPTGSALTTGAFTLVARCRCPLSNPASNSNIALLNDVAALPFAGKEFIARFESSGELRVLIFGATSSNFNRWTYSNFLGTYAGQIIHLAIVRNAAGNPTIYVNGVDVTASGSFDASAGAGWQATVDTDYMVHGGATTQEGALFRSALYNVALNSSQVAADYAGTAQSGNIVWINFGLVAKMASSFVCTTGQTVTINTSGATGARICGERDLYQGTVANQPVLLQWAGQNYGYLTGASGNYLSAPDSAAISITGNIDIRAFAALNDWTPAATTSLVSKWASGQLSYNFCVTSTGLLRLITSNDGTATNTFTSSVAPTVSDFAALWVRVAFTVADRVATFYTSPDGVTWTPLGTPTASGGATTIFNSTAVLEIGSSAVGTSDLLAGRVFRAQIYNGVAGTLAFDFNAAAYQSGTTLLDQSANGATITLNGGACIATRTGLYFDGSNDYLKAAPFSLSQPHVLYFVGSQVTWGANLALCDGNTADTMRVVQSDASTDLRIRSGGTEPAGTEVQLALGTSGLLSACFSTTAGVLRKNRGSQAQGNIGSATPNGFTLGSRHDGGGPSNITASEVAIYAAAQPTSILDRFAKYAINKWRIAA